MGLDLSRVNLSGTDLRNAKLGSNLNEIDLSLADLSGANLTGANLTGANLTGANLIGADLSKAILTKTIFRQASMLFVSLQNADLSDADLSDARLNAADLRGASLIRTNLNGTNLTGAYISHEMKAQLFDRGTLGLAETFEKPQDAPTFAERIHSINDVSFLNENIRLLEISLEEYKEEYKQKFEASKLAPQFAATIEQYIISTKESLEIMIKRREQLTQ